MSEKLYILYTMYSMLKNAMQHSAHLLRQHVEVCKTIYYIYYILYTIYYVCKTICTIYLLHIQCNIVHTSSGSSSGRSAVLLSRSAACIALTKASEFPGR